MKKDVHTQLAIDGFVIVDLLNPDDIAYLNKLCNSYLKNTTADFVSSSHILNQKDSEFINDELHNILHHTFEKLFPELQLLGGTLATKIKGASNLEAHQDWTIVNEAMYSSYNLWIPLVDTSSENGTLGLIAGSHKWNQALRGYNIPNPFGKYTKQFLQLGFEPSLKAGQAILYNHKLIHYSRPNTTNAHRNVAIVGVKDKAADLQISLCLDHKNIDTYTMTESHFYGFDKDKIVESQKKIKTSVAVSEDISWCDIYKNYSRYAGKEFAYPKNKKLWLTRIFDNLFLCFIFTLQYWNK